MLINQLDYVIFIVSMIFAINLGISESNSDEDDSVLVRSRRQLDLDEDVKTCTDKCVLYMRAYPEAQGVYTLKEIRDACKQHCQEKATKILAEFQQNKQEQGGAEEVQDYYRPSQPISSSKADCEMKCLANKEAFTSLTVKQRIKICRKNCANS